MAHALEEEVQLKDTWMHDVSNDIQYKHNKWTFNHQKFTPHKDSLSHIYTEANRDQVLKNINNRTAQ